jgi:lysozyme family protein
MQFFNPSLKNPPVQPGHDLLATNPPPPEVATLLRQACYDCHSNETRWPWYAHVAPVSWWIVGHMKEARDDLNFSEWPHGDTYVAGDQLGRIGEQVQSRKMPLPSYTWLGMHSEARLNEEQRGRILKWTEQAAQQFENETKK